jgi:Ca-activated chloride channel family protein
MLMEIIDTGIIPQPGSALGDAVEKALAAFVTGENKYKVIVLITDGEDHNSEPLKAAEKAASEGVTIYTVGIGSPDGSPILTDGESGERVYKKDREGQMVLSRLDETTLRRMADITGGKYYRATSGGDEFRAIYDEIAAMEEKELETRRFATYEERFQYPLALAILCLMLEFLVAPPKKEKPEASR